MTDKTKSTAVAVTAGSAMILLKGTEAITKAILSIHVRGKKLDRDIWVAAVSALAHHNEHGDTTLINKLIECMPKGSRVNALRAFVDAVGKVKYNDKTGVYDHDKDGNFDLCTAVETSWVEYKPEQPHVPFDAVAAIKKVVARLDAAIKLGEPVDAAHAQSIRTLAASMGL